MEFHYHQTFSKCYEHILGSRMAQRSSGMAGGGVRENQSRILVCERPPPRYVSHLTPWNCQHYLVAYGITYCQSHVGVWWSRKRRPSRQRRQGDTWLHQGRVEVRNRFILESPSPMTYWAKIAFFLFLGAGTSPGSASVPRAGQVTVSRQPWTCLSPSNETA